MYDFFSIIAEYTMDGVIFIVYEVQLQLVTEKLEIELKTMNITKQIGL